MNHSYPYNFNRACDYWYFLFIYHGYAHNFIHAHANANFCNLFNGCDQLYFSVYDRDRDHANGCGSCDEFIFAFRDHDHDYENDYDYAYHGFRDCIFIYLIF